MTSTQRTDYDVIIVGGGLAGTSTAICLAQLDPSLKDRVLILEKDEHPREKGCGGGINDGVIQWLGQHGIRLSVRPLGMESIRVAMGGDDPARDILLKPADFKTINRKEFDEDLFQHALSIGIPALQNEPALSAHLEADKVTVKTDTREFSTRILVGADGARGIVRPTLYRDLGLHSPARTGRTLYCLVPIQGNSFEEMELEAVLDFAFAFNHGVPGYAWSFPTMIKKRKWLNTGICSFGDPGNSELSLADVFSRFLNTRDLSPDRKEFSSHPIPGFHPASVMSGTRVLLTGDSAGVDPLLGEGVSFALHYGEVAAKCILEALKTDDFSFSSYREELSRHGIVDRLQELWEISERIYHSSDTGNWRDILYQALAP